LRYPLAPLWTPGSGRPDEASVDALVDRLVAQHGALSAHLTAQADALRAAAERNFDVLADLVRDEGTSQGETEPTP